MLTGLRVVNTTLVVGKKVNARVSRRAFLSSQTAFLPLFLLEGLRCITNTEGTGSGTWEGRYTMPKVASAGSAVVF